MAVLTGRRALSGDSRAARPRRGQFRALTVARVDRLCADAAAVTFAVPEALAEEFRFEPGQALTLRRMVDGREERRSYSICAPAGQPLRIGVREVPGGAVSGWLVREVQPGDQIEVQPPSGSFTPDLSAQDPGASDPGASDPGASNRGASDPGTSDPGAPGRHVLIAAGSGITPVLSIAASVLASGNSEATLLYGNRRSDTVMFADEVADLKDAYPARLQLVHVLSRERQEVELFSGRLDADRLRLLIPVAAGDPADVDHWWLCGPYGMVTDAKAVLASLGIPPDRVHRELFYVEDTAPEPERHVEQPQTGCEVTIVLDGRRTMAVIPAGTPVLDGAQLVRPDLPFACKGGVCGTCRARLVSGEVTMRRNFALEQAELDAGFVLTCQSLPVSAELTVDYDA